ncbi:MAG: CBS domain-containing protein, partial [Chloroflexota bacterium]
KHGAFDYLNKPCEIDLLAAKINDAYNAAKKGVKEEKKAKDIMIPLEQYTTVDEDDTVKEGIEALRKSYESFLSTGRIMETGHRSILVFDRKGAISGILSIMDLIVAIRPAYLSAPKPSMADALQYSPMFWSGLFTIQTKALVKKKVKDIMSEPPMTVDEDANLMEVADMLYTRNARRLGVTSIKSRMSRLGAGVWARASRASWPVAAVSISYPACLRMAETAVVILGSSSTMRMHFLLILLSQLATLHPLVVIQYQ